MEALTFMILDMESGNAVAFYDSRKDAERGLQRAVRKRPEEAANLMLIAYNNRGRSRIGR